MIQLLWRNLRFLLYVRLLRYSSPNQDAGLLSKPIANDRWCQERCSNHQQCLDMFGDDYVDLKLIVTDFSGPFDRTGEELMNGLFLGNTISRQTFEAQFILDMSLALSVSPCKIYMLHLDSDRRGGHWDVANVIIHLRIIPTEFNTIQNLSKQVQDPSSDLYDGKVTYKVDPLFGTTVLRWDFSLKLMYSANVVGARNVKYMNDIQVLDEGSKRWCEHEDNQYSDYCEFESYFQQDLSHSLSIAMNQVDVLFVKSAGKDSIFITFRFIPSVEASPWETLTWLNIKRYELLKQINDDASVLYQGNVTYRIDPTWGLSGTHVRRKRHNSHRLRRPMIESKMTPYERSKATHRSGNGNSNYIQNSASSQSTTASFPGGKQNTIPLFADFEDWRQGTYGWEQGCNSVVQDCGMRALLSQNIGVSPKPYGSHWSPFDFLSLGPLIPSFKDSINSGLVLNRAKLDQDIIKQQKQVDEVINLLRWIKRENATCSLGATSRTRYDISKKLYQVELEYKKMLVHERKKLATLLASQCQNQNIPCTLLFNTSNLELRGAINASGELVVSSDGAEVAVWSFDSIDLGVEVNVKVTGQRAMALMSRSSIYIDTILNVKPGTLGGFPGGFSTFRHKDNTFSSVCNEALDEYSIKKNCDDYFSTCCPGDGPLNKMLPSTVSNNINGPGSGSVRIYLFVIETKAPVVHEIQKIVTNADRGQVIRGGFKLNYKNYTSTFIAHDTDAKCLKRALEDTMNAANANILHQIDRRDVLPGIGKVQVSRKTFGSSGGYEWKLTFTTAIGNIGDVDSRPLTVTNLLSGIGATVAITTLRDGNSIGGSFSLKLLGSETSMLDHDVSGEEMQSVLNRDIPSVESASVIRTDPLGNCNDGLCENGPQQAGGYLWTVTITTKVGNISPHSPTSPLFDIEGNFSEIISKNELIGCVDTICPTIVVYPGHGKSPIQSMKSTTLHKPFSLSYGGSGGSHGGRGGEGFNGYSENDVYGDKYLSVLHGGSGGSLGIHEPHELNFVSMLSKVRGGSGGGALEIVAINDLMLGPNSAISSNGEKGWDGFMSGGGGGSGGGLLMAAGGIVKLDGYISAVGGDGGVMQSKTEKGVFGIDDGGGGGGGGGGRIAIYGKSISVSKQSQVHANGGKCVDNATYDGVDRFCAGSNGSIYMKKQLWQEIYVDEKEGAQGTNKSLYIKPSFNSWKVFEDCNETQRLDWPTFVFDKPEKPGRLSFNVLFRSDHNKSIKNWQGLSIDILSSPVDHFNKTLIPTLRLSFGHEMKYEEFYGGSCNVQFMKNTSVFFLGTFFDHWYKIDIKMNWEMNMFDIYLDDAIVKKGALLAFESVEAIMILSPFASSLKTWLDEIYVGKDTSMGFECPSITKHEPSPRDDLFIERGWKRAELGDSSTFHEMKYHESHLSHRPIYRRSDMGGLSPFDGMPHRYYTHDIKNNSSQHLQSEYADGRLVKFKSLNHDNTEELFIWYAEHEDGEGIGGVGACSTSDFVTWKNEGIMLNNANLTDMVNGHLEPLHVENPHVLFNPQSGKFVLWMVIDNAERNLAMSGIAISDYANGPFTFLRSFYPDGNETREQVLLQGDDGKAYLVRSYFATTEYALPSSVMQPIWESVKNMDNSSSFALTYHRAHYEEGYDNYHDIHIQRWRNEDKAWKVICINLESRVERDISDLENIEDNCILPFEYKKVIGQYNLLQANSMRGIQSRFLDPMNPHNNFWRPSSVPGVKAQSWRANYQDGYCGMNNEDDDIQKYDPNQSIRNPKNRRVCSNIIDNPIHQTSPDKREGASDVVEKRRVKFVAVSRLTDDYLDTIGEVHSYEGELENGVDLTVLVHNAKGVTNNFQGEDSVQRDSLDTKLSKYAEFKQTFDWDTQFHQYEQRFNDRAYYSTACVLDKRCPVNFTTK